MLFTTRDLLTIKSLNWKTNMWQYWNGYGSTLHIGSGLFNQNDIASTSKYLTWALCGNVSTGQEKVNVQSASQETQHSNGQSL